MPSIPLSPKHGLNPSLEQCFFCGEAKGVILFGKIRGGPEYGTEYDREAPRMVCINHEPCDKCAEHMKLGVMLIQVRDKDPSDNPYRTGVMCVLKDEAITRIIQPELAAEILKKRVAFVLKDDWELLGLPTEVTK